VEGLKAPGVSEKRRFSREASHPAPDEAAANVADGVTEDYASCMVNREGRKVVLRDTAPLALAALLPLILVVHEGGLLAAIPLLVLVIPLLLGRFPGEKVLERLAAQQNRARPSRPLDLPRPPRPIVTGLLRTRLLIAASFAERPPPGLTQA
jgi:hypothetical protein